MKLRKNIFRQEAASKHDEEKFYEEVLPISFSCNARSICKGTERIQNISGITSKLNIFQEWRTD